MVRNVKNLGEAQRAITRQRAAHDHGIEFNVPRGGITVAELNQFYNMITVGGTIVLPIEENEHTSDAVKNIRRIRRGLTEDVLRMRVVAKNAHTMTLECCIGAATLTYTPSYIKVLTDLIRRFGRWDYADGICSY